MGVAVDVGVGVGRLGVGVGEGAAGEVADGDGFAVVGDAEAEGSVAGGGVLMTAGALVTGDRLGGDVALDDPGLGVTEAAEPDGLPWPDRAAGGCGVCEPPSASTVMIPVATTAIRTPTAAATPDNASHRCLGGLIGYWKAVGPERAGPLHHVPPVLQRKRPYVAAQPQHLLTQLGRGRGQRRHPVQRGRPQHAVLALGADVALVDVAADPLARQPGQPAIPVLEQHVEFRASPPPGTGHPVDAVFAVATARSPSHTRSLQLGSQAGPTKKSNRLLDLQELGGAEGI